MSIFVVLLVLVVTTWIYTIYLSWKHRSGATYTPITESMVTARTGQWVRLTRRGWYSTRMSAKRALLWIGARTQRLITTLFPKSAAAFAKHDVLTGLQTGPSSYFLKQISPTRPARVSRSPRAKKDAKMVDVPE